MGSCACTGWTAFHDHMPGKRVTLRVSAECSVGQLGSTAVLTRHEPQGINPKDLLLDLKITPPEIGAPAMNTTSARFEEETEFEYETVSVIDCESGIPVQCLEK